MKKILLFSILYGFVISAEAQFLKKLKAKVDQSAGDVKTKVIDKAEKTPDRVIDHAANKVENKADSKIDSIETRANTKVDKTVDKADSIQIKKPTPKESKDSVPGSVRINFSDDAKKKIEKVQLIQSVFYNSDNTALLFLYDNKNILFNLLKPFYGITLSQTPRFNNHPC
jgi:5-hydroxyisourate hydrolase-like protein (transthyretin family)